MIATPNEVANEILTFGNGDNPDFNNWPQSISEAAECWANVVDVCAANVVPTSTTATAARAAFITEFNNMSNEAQNGYLVFANALMQYATILGTGMTGAGFNGFPPPTLFVFNMQGFISGSANEEAIRFGTDLVNWFKTGTATNINTGTTINWN